MRRPFGLASALALVVAFVVTAGGDVQASSLPVRIHAGTCDAPGDLLATVAGVSPEGGLAATASPVVRSIADALGTPVEISLLSLPLALAELTAEGRALIIDAGAAHTGTLAVCGEFAGFEPGSPDIQVGLGAAGSSVGAGVAWLHDNGDGTTTVSVVVAAVTRVRVVIAIRDFFYIPDPLEVEAGTTVTWTNEDLTPHTATAYEGTFDSGYMAQWDSFSQTFHAPGTFDYFCAFHPRMTATVTVG